jgi:hypothetical protein
MTMSKELEQKLTALNYNGPAQVQYEALVSVFSRGLKEPALIDMVLERLTTADCQEIIQIEYC